MTTRWGTGAALGASILMLALAAGCTGGTEGAAAEEAGLTRNGVESASQSSVDPRQRLDQISPAIPLYAGAQYRDDLTRRDAVAIRNQYGPNAQVYTLASNDSYPQVFHYYTTYLAQYRGFPAQETYPPVKQNWRTLEVQLNQAMQDPFIPGEGLKPGMNQVILQVAETEAQPKTVIRYIVAPPQPAPVTTAGASDSGQTAVR
ncbi:MAG TPA: hypothetical protein VMS98_15500 [Thermoanaerobaculia bacterium]|nr:hypothetical protein [Thermoanaerobaculia bacterium]